MSIVKGIFTRKNHTEDLSTDIDLDALFKEFYHRLVYFSMQFVKDEHKAQDIAQDSFIKYWQQKDTVAADQTAIKNFLYSTVKNASLNVIRHQKVVEGYIQLQGTAEPEQASVMEAIIAAEVMQEVHSAIQALPENYRQISMMGYFDGKKNCEIADELNMSINTVKKQKQKALQLLRMKLSPEMFFFLLALSIHSLIAHIPFL